MSVTFVTALYDLKAEDGKNRRDIASYIEFGVKYTLSLKCPLVIFTEDKLFTTIHDHRKKIDQLENTFIIVRPFNELFWNQHRQLMNDNQALLPVNCYNVDKDTVPYHILNWSKLSLVHDASKVNFWKSTHFAWIDFGLAHVAVYTDPDALVKNIVKTSKMKMLEMSHPCSLEVASKNYLMCERGKVCGGFMTIPVDSIKQMTDHFFEQGMACLKSRLITTDQMIFSMMIYHHPDLFELYYGDYSSLLVNYGEITQDVPVIIHFNVEHCLKLRDIAHAQAVAKRLLAAYQSGNIVLTQNYVDSLSNLVEPKNNIKLITK